MRISIGASLTVPRIVLVVGAVFVLVLFQNLPQDALPTLTQLWHAVGIAIITAITLLLQGGSGGSPGGSIPISGKGKC